MILMSATPRPSFSQLIFAKLNAGGKQMQVKADKNLVL